MSELTDQHLLAAWAERRDEAAFRSLLGRYAGFVYGVTLRRTADAGLAEEISQDVFARLAQNAHRLTDHPTLAGWLHRSAMIITLDRLRRRTRHSQKLERFTQMNTQTGRDPWADAAPHLDEALDRLATRDREVLMLHFIEQRTFPEIAARLRNTPDAVRMRTNRALAELSRLLGKRGAVIPAAALAAGLSAATAAPPSLLLLAPAALAGAGKVSALSVVIHALQTMKLAKAAAITLLALVLATPLIFQQQQIAAAEARIAGLQLDRPLPVTERATKSATDIIAAKKPGRGIEIKALGDAALDDFRGPMLIQQAAARLDTNNLVGLIEIVMQGGLLPQAREKLLERLLFELATRDRPLHVEWALKVLSGTIPNASIDFHYGGRIRSEMRASFRVWSNTNPEQAMEWAAIHADEWASVKGPPLNAMAAAIAFVRTPERGLEIMQKLSLVDYDYALGNIATIRRTDEDFARLAKWAASIPDQKQRREFVLVTLQSRNSLLFPGGDVAQRMIENSDALLGELRLNEEDLSFVASRIAARCDGIFRDPDSMAKKAFPWLEKILPPNLAGYSKGRTMAATDNPNKALQILSAELEREHRDDVIQGYVEYFAISEGWSETVGQGSHAENAFQLASSARDPMKRIDLLSDVWRAFNRSSPAVAAKAKQSSGLTHG